MKEARRKLGIKETQHKPSYLKAVMYKPMCSLDRPTSHQHGWILTKLNYTDRHVSELFRLKDLHQILTKTV